MSTFHDDNPMSNARHRTVLYAVESTCKAGASAYLFKAGDEAEQAEVRRKNALDPRIQALVDERNSGKHHEEAIEPVRKQMRALRAQE